MENTQKIDCKENKEEKKELTPEEKWDKATIANNFIFYKVMHNNPDVCKELLEILLEFKIDHIKMKQEDVVEIDYGKKGIRMDVYAVGEKNAYNIEMQAIDTKELPERARYYQGVLDVDDLNQGELYKNLRTCYVIFICIKDIFNKGLAKYTFENICVENPEIKLNDRTFKCFFISENYDKVFNEKQKEFLKLVTKNESSSEFSDKISKLVEDAKHNTQWRKQFMDLEREKTYAYETGISEGHQQKAIEAARSFYANGASLELIAKSLKMTVEQVKEIVSEKVTAVPASTQA